MDSTRYLGQVRSERWLHRTLVLLVLLLVHGLGLGCAHSPRPPSAPEARRPTPASVTPKNPAGDAREPEDAALARLLDAPRGRRSDRFGTLAVHLPDDQKWRRTRIFGHPLRVSYRYGDDNYAVQMIDYRQSVDDNPASCLTRLSTRMTSLAEAFSLELEPLEFGLSRHLRGVESVDWKLREAEQLRRAEQRASDQLRRAEQRASDQLRRAEQPASDQLRRAEQPASDQLRRAEQPASERDRHARSPDTEQQQPRIHATVPIQAQAPSLSAPLLFAGRRTLPSAPRYGYAEMPFVRTSGAFMTVFNQDRYIGAAVAYRSWPGTCLIQGFAVRIGTDELLARRVVDRWLSEFAPLLSWGVRLRAAPPIQNR
ncbi:MAG: hypothetical protein EXR75_13295 [Myxococcales bacterium]|nr:hypothetical protein [Myxococcales bacterium]